jgi:hypothetical protein
MHSATHLNTRELSFSDIAAVSGGSYAQACVTGAGAGGFIGGLIGNLPGAAAGAVIGCGAGMLLQAIN